MSDSVDILHGAAAIAEFLGLTERQVYHHATETKTKRRTLPVFKIGPRLCARRSTLLAWIEQQESQAHAPAGTAPSINERRA